MNSVDTLVNSRAAQITIGFSKPQMARNHPRIKEELGENLLTLGQDGHALAKARSKDWILIDIDKVHRQIVSLAPRFQRMDHLLTQMTMAANINCKMV